MRDNQSGMTIVELLIAIAIASILSTVVMIISVNFFGSTIRSQVTAQMATDSHYALRAIVEDIRISDKVAAGNTLPDSNQPSGGWLTSDADNVLVLDLPATDENVDIIYDDTTGNPYSNEYIYFISNNTLYKRLLRNDSATGNTTLTTCPEELSGSSCPGDRNYAPYVTDLSFTFYDASNNLTNDPVLARSVEVTISMQKQVFGSMVTMTNTIYTKLRN